MARMDGFPEQMPHCLLGPCLRWSQELSVGDVVAPFADGNSEAE